MGFLSSQVGLPVHGRGDMLEGFLSLMGRTVTSGVRVNNYTAMNYSAVWAATRLLTGTISTLPKELYLQSGESKNPDYKHSTRKVFKYEPNEYQSSVVHLEQQFNFLINWGNCYAEIERDEFGRVSVLWPIHPERVYRYDEDEDIYYVRNEDGSASPISGEDMFHVAGLFPEDGRFGRGVIQHAAESIGMGLATEQFGASLFGNGAGPAMVLTHPKTLSPQAAENLRRSWSRRRGGPSNANGVLVLEEGTTVTPITIPPEQAQFLQTRQFNITEIARWYNLPPHLLRELSKSSFNNIESESLHFIQISIMPWLVRYEEECHRQLLMDHEKESRFFKFIVHGLLRGDMKTQAAFFKEMWGIGVYDINEIRELLDMNPIDDGDSRFVPMNMATLEKAVAPEPEPEPEPIEQSAIEDDDSEEEEEPEDATDTAARQAIRHSLSCVLSGMIGYESRQAVRMASNPREFEDKCRRFYSDKFRQTFAREVGPLLASSRMMGSPVVIDEFVAGHTERSQSELLALLDKPMSEFAAAVQETVNGWDSRAFEEVASLFGDESC